MRQQLAFLLCLCLLLGGCSAGTDTGPVSSTSPSAAEPSELPEASAKPSAGAEKEPRLLGSGEIVYGEGIAPLTEDQEAAVHAYMISAYESLARLEQPDFSQLFTDPVQARASESGIALQIGMRTLIDGVDYSLTGYSYTLACSGTAQLEDGAVEMTALERSVQNFAQFAGVDSERGRNFHHFVLEEVDGAWKLRSHMQYDILYGRLMESEANWRGDYAQAYIDAMPAYLEELRAAQAERASAQGENAQLPAADEPYDRTAALAYAGEYAMSRNPDWADFSRSGGNCQNYVSQCLLAGSIPADPYGDAVWTYGGDGYERSGSWASVSQFRRYASGNTDFGLVSLVGAPYYSGQPGDLIQMGDADSWHHTVIIGDVVVDETGNTVDYLIHSNTNDMKNFPASLYGYPVFSLTRIAGWNG